MTWLYVLAAWVGLACIVAPFVGRLLARRSDECPTPDELLAWHRALRDDEATRAWIGGDR